ncbi:MAG TPA: glycoside hydrolase family 3 N-terminal domain-containing protein [Phycisphaerae bacterium]|nr:glycoside hydrolase family 3 N-terminal domain-containing protein [Phycisphaerae bacterium]
MRALALNELTTEQKIGQMLLARRPVNREGFEAILDLIRDRCLGGLHLSESLPDLPVPRMVEKIHEVADYPLLLCENMEQGFTNARAIPFPDQMGIGASGSEDLAYEAGRITAIEAKSRGFNVVFGPIVDLAMHPRACCVGPRCFAADAETVARMASAMIRGYQDNGMIVTAKHYPGFGESEIDSHLGMVYLTCDRELLLERELRPYLEAMRTADLSGVMVGHIMVPKIDPKYPASLSPALIGLLREAGYDGLIMTDSLAMVGLTNLFGLEQCHGLAMAAGNDMVMTSYRLDNRVAYEYMLKAHRAGQVSDEQVDSAARHVLAAQARTLRPASQPRVTDADHASALRVSESAPAAVLRGAASPALATDKRHLFLVQVSNDFTNPANGKRYIDRDGQDTRDMEPAVRRLFPRSDVIPLSDYPSAVEIEHACSTSMKYDSVVMVAYAWTHSYTGSSDLTRRLISLLDGLSHKLSAVVLIGNPYAARELPPTPRLIWAPDGGFCREAALKVLAGQLQPVGKIPVPLTLRDAPPR